MAKDDSSKRLKNAGLLDRALGRSKLREEFESKVSLRDKKIIMLEKYLRENKHELAQLEKKLDENIRFDKGVYPLALERVDKKLKLAQIEKDAIQGLLKRLSKKHLNKKMKNAKKKKYAEKLKEINEEVGELNYYKKGMEKSLGK